MKYMALIAALVAAVLLSAPARGGQSLCGPYPLVAAELRSQYGERPIWRWLSPSGLHLVEFWRSEAHATVSIVAMDTRGAACIVAAGEGSEPIDNQPGGGATH